MRLLTRLFLQEVNGHILSPSGFFGVIPNNFPLYIQYMCIYTVASSKEFVVHFNRISLVVYKARAVGQKGIISSYQKPPSKYDCREERGIFTCAFKR